LTKKKNGEVIEELKVELVEETLRRYKSNWLQGHVTRMNDRMPKIMPNFKRNGGKQLGKILKSLLDETDRGLSKPNWWWWWWW